jgi:hypothetical protein
MSEIMLEIILEAKTRKPKPRSQSQEAKGKE